MNAKTLTLRPMPGVITPVVLVVDTVASRATFPTPIRFKAAWYYQGHYVYMSKTCDTKKEAEGLARKYLAKNNHLTEWRV